MATQYTKWNGILEEGDMNVVTIHPLESDPKFLGHHPEYNLPDDHPLKDMAYAEIERSAKLPKYHSEDRDFKCKPSKEYFKKLWDGDVEMHWREVWDNDPIGFYLCVVADDMARDLISTLDPVPELHCDKYVLSICISQPSQPYCSPDSCVGSSPCSNLSYDNNPLKSFYHLSQLESLMFRMIHRFYRIYANQLSFFNLDQVNAHLKIFYMKENLRFTESIDVDMIRADVIVFGENGTYHNQIHPIRKLSQALQGKGRCSEAARICESIVAHWDHLNNVVTGPENGFEPSQVMRDAGQAYHHAHRLADAERCLVKAIWMDCNQQQRLGKPTSVWEWDTFMIG
ncbi:MAG: hypothetical protein SGARI_000637 [Bacillariaceae sp.]